MPPAVAVEFVSCQPSARAGEWRLTWEIRNQGQQPLRLLAARLPHGRFRCDEQELDARPPLRPRQAVRLELLVRCREAPGAEVENAFLILRAAAGAETWRILARFLVIVGPGGVPTTTTEAVTAVGGRQRQEGEPGGGRH